MKIIDQRVIPPAITFRDIDIGEAFQDNEGDIHIKTDVGMTMYWDERQQQWIPCAYIDNDDVVILLEVTYTIERSSEK